MSSIKKIDDDPRLRPFLSSHFDPQTYIKNVIKEGRSEESFKEIGTCVEEVNEEIKGYISQHKDDLMSGMQDVAALAERYLQLHSHSQKLNKTIDRLKKEALESYDLVNLRTMELENIHTTSIALRHLRQFVHCRAQLDHHLRAAAGGGVTVAAVEGAGVMGIEDGGHAISRADIRHLASFAKTLNELETIMSVPGLQEIDYVAIHTPAVRVFGEKLREHAQEKLLTALDERNQAFVAASLQVFFNLQSLPEIVMLALHTTVKQTIEMSRAALDLDGIVLTYPELLSQVTATAAATAGLSLGASKRAAAAAAAAGPQALPVSSQLRMGMREAAHQWSTLVFEQAMQIHVLQRVVAKKEDPNTHVRFSEVLRTAGNASNNPVLASGRLLELYWNQLCLGLQDVAAEKLRAQPHAASRMYPSLRKAAVDIVDNLKALSNRDLHRDAQMGMGFSGLAGFSGVDADVFDYGGGSGVSGSGSTPVSSGSGTGTGEGVFGSLSWSSSGGCGDLLGSLGMGSRRSAMRAGGSGSGGGTSSTSFLSSSSRNNHLSSGFSSGGIHRYRDQRRRAAAAVIDDISSSSVTAAGDHPHDDESSRIAALLSSSADSGLVGGLKPLRDRYLAGALSRMIAPVNQMFPEMDGYTAAVPSKRDMQTLVKALQSELTSAAIEGDLGLLQAVSKESVKAVQLMVSKVESMVITNADASRINFSTTTASAAASSHTVAAAAAIAFTRTVQQEHNAQLVGLLAQLREALYRIPSHAIKTAQETPGSSFAASSSSSSGSTGSDLTGLDGLQSSLSASASSDSKELQAQAVMEHTQHPAVVTIDEAISKQLLLPLVNAIAGHIKSLLVPVLKEGAGTGASHSQNGDDANADCSRAVQALLRQLPEINKTYIASLAKSPAVGAAAEELGLRILHMYVTLAALMRPVSEQSRLRTARDMTALEAGLAGVSLGGLGLGLGHHHHSSGGNNPSQQQGGGHHGKDFNKDAKEEKESREHEIALQSCPIMQEFRSFRRFLFMDENEGVAGTSSGTSSTIMKTTLNRSSSSSNGNANANIPSRGRLLSLSYFSSLRPSTVLGHLIACGPTQLPSPYDSSGASIVPKGAVVSAAVQAYVDSLVNLSNPNLNIDSVRKLYPTTSATTVASSVSSFNEWRKIPTEVQSWEAVQASLDVFVQRISVADGAQKAAMRAWYEALLEIGGMYFGNA